MSPPPGSAILNTLLQNMVHMQPQLVNLTKTTIQYSLTPYYHHNPLSMHILNVPLSQRIEIPKFDKFNGEGDPKFHVNAFTPLYNGFHHQDPLLVKLFVGYLNGIALEWHFSLPNNLILTFDQFMNKFL